MSKGSIALLVILIALVLGGLFWHKSALREGSAAEARREAIALLAHITPIQAQWTYVGGLIDRHHDEAARAAFTSGGLLAQDVFDDEVYLGTLWKLISASAVADQKLDVADGLPYLPGDQQDR